MAIPSGYCPLPYISDKNAFLLRLQAAYVIAFMSCASEGSPLIQVPRNPEMASSNPISSNLLSATMEHLDCYLDSSNPDSLNSEFDESFYCLPGEHMTSQDDPCPGSQLCCQCRPGSFLTKENTCSTCIPHTECEEVEIMGDGFTDNVCVQAQSGKGDDITPNPPSSDPSDDGTEEVDTSQDVSTDTPPPRPPDNGTKQGEVDATQDGQNSELNDGFVKCICIDGWEGQFCQTDSAELSNRCTLTLILTIVVIVAIVLIVVLAILIIRSRGKRRDSRSHTMASGDDEEMRPMRSPKSRGDRGFNVDREN